MAPLLTLKRTTRFALVACAALAALPPVFAQPAGAPPYDAAARQPGGDPSGGDPPGRVARLNYLSGAVTTEPAGTDTWSYAAVNRPLTTGDQLWNDAGARSELHVGSTAVRLGESTSLSVMNLDDTTTQLKVGLGSVSTHVRSLPPGTSYEIDTPNLALGITRPGDYRVDVAPNGASTTVTVRRGSATVYGENGQFPLSPGQQVVFTGTRLQVARQSPAPGLDPLDRWAAGRDANEDRSISARYVSRDMPGYQDLDANGTWREHPGYGAMWVPSDVPDGWAPYHDGRWIWQAPWGWTWVDDEPWGFAPYHYGRWAYVDDSWAWVPGPLVVSAPPVYAPALVAFVGGDDGGSDWSVGLTAGGIAAAGVAWFPLGPGESWHPRWGGWSPRYYARVNQNIVVNHINVNKTVNVTNITNTYVNYRAPHAITAVPATAFVHGQPVAHFSQHVDPQQWRHAHVTPGTPGIAPVRQSFTGGLRTAAYQPPAEMARHPVMATRNPAVPAAYRDQAAAQLVQHGGRVPGAGVPVVKTAVPPDYTPRPVRMPGNPQEPRWAMRNVQLVNPHSPVVRPTQEAGEGQSGRLHAGSPGLAAAGLGAAAAGMAAAATAGHPMSGPAANAPRVRNGFAPNMPRAQNAGAPNTPHPMNGATPNVPPPPNGTARHAAGAPEHGVPHPPTFGNAPGMRGDARIAQPRPQPDFAAPEPQPQPRPRPDRAAPTPHPRPDYAPPAPRQDYAPPHGNEYRAPAPAREIPRPQPAMQIQAPRMDARPQVQAPRMDARPQMQAPHMDTRPQMQAPHMDAHPPMLPPHVQNNPAPHDNGHDNRRRE